ncbi:MAG: hypothetical protein MUC45_09690 [Actinomycetia bacterium]|jgi:hypothetical protein|nr:hypothetical protein [Actinomycetes bacterium]
MPRRAGTRLDALEAVARAQLGLVTFDQLLACDLPSSTLRHRIRSGGPWRRVLPTVYYVASGPLDVVQREQAALLYAGDEALITGVAALRRHGVEYLPADPLVEPVHLLVPHDRRPRSVGFALVERTLRLPRPVASHALPTAPLARAVVDAARRTLDRRAVRALAAEVVQRRRVSLAGLGAEVDAAQIRGTALIRAAVGDLRQGVQSAPEAEFRDLILGSGLPEPLWNPTLLTPDGQFLCRPDAYYEDVGVAMEINSLRHHLSPADFETTQTRHAQMAAWGIIVLPITPGRARWQGDRVLNDVSAARRAAAGRPRPLVIVVPFSL